MYQSPYPYTDYLSWKSTLIPPLWVGDSNCGKRGDDRSNFFLLKRGVVRGKQLGLHSWNGQVGFDNIALDTSKKYFHQEEEVSWFHRAAPKAGARLDSSWIYWWRSSRELDTFCEQSGIQHLDFIIAQVTHDSSDFSGWLWNICMPWSACNGKLPYVLLNSMIYGITLKLTYSNIF